MNLSDTETEIANVVYFWLLRKTYYLMAFPICIYRMTITDDKVITFLNGE